jgi:hypothetical protein
MIYKLLSITALGLALACSEPVRKPLMGGKMGASPAEPGTKGGSGDGTGTGTGNTGSESINKEALKALADEIVAPTSDHCEAGTDKAVLPKEGRSILRLMTREEYNNTVKDLFGLNKNFTESLSAEQKILGFSNNSTINLVGEQTLSSYIATARDVAKTALNENSNLVCKDGAGCAEKILASVGNQAWRRPMEASEKTRLLALYQTASADGVKIGLEVMLTGLLTSPQFLYRSEMGKDGKLSSYEVASALSYFFWATTPDAELRKAAEDGSLLDAKVMAAQAKRLMSNERAKAGVNSFSDAYLAYSNVSNISKNVDRFKEFTTEVRTAMTSEARDTFDYWVRKKNLKFKDIFSAQQSVGDDNLANFYGTQTVQTDNVKMIDFNGSQRQGVLGFGAILALLATADESHPIKRGIYIREHLLCETMAPTPPGLVIAIPPIKAGMTTRERFAIHTSNAQCSSCHNLIDGVGFGMEDFDGVGRFRDKDGDKPVDDSGVFVGLDGKDQKFNGVQGMSDLLKTSDRAKRCFVLQVFRQAAGRFENKADVCGIRNIADDFIKSDKSLTEVFLNVITNPVYYERAR